MKLLYTANVRMPTEKAYGIQIMEMCSALAHARGMTRIDTPVVAPSRFTTGRAWNDAENFLELVVPMRKNPNFQGIDPFQYYGVEKNFTITTLKTFDPWWLIWLPGGVYTKIQGLLFIISLFFYFLRHPKFNLGSRNKQQKEKDRHRERGPDPDRDERGDLVQTREMEIASDDGSGQPSSLAMTEGEVIFYTRDEYLLPFLLRHSSDVVWEGHTLPARRERYVKYWNQCRAIVAITKGLKDELVGLGVAGEKILVAPDGVDLDKYHVSGIKYQARKECGLPTDRKIVLYTGQLFEWKGADVLLEAAREIQYPVFVFVGGMKEDVERFKRKAEGLENVLILGHQSHDMIPLYQMLADVLVMPNKMGSDISERWTSPLKCFEYMASRVPIVASDLPSIREVLDESNSVLVEPNNPQALAGGVQKILQNQELADTIAQKANEDVREYSWEKRASNIIAFIEKA